MRSIEELMKLEKYEGLEHNEVILLINQSLANQALAHQEIYNRLLERIKRCMIDGGIL